MDIIKAKTIAEDLLKTHNLHDWKFKFSHAKLQFGFCRYAPSKVISLSKHLTLLNPENQVLDTILHEIAHALVGPKNGHNRKWKNTAKSIGCTGERCYKSEDVITPSPSIIGVCPKCGNTIHRHRSRYIACGKCCKAYNNGRFSKEFVYVWKRGSS